MQKTPQVVIDRARKAEKLLQAFAVKSTTEPTEDWVKLGSLLWEHSYEGGLSDGAAFDRMAKWIDYEAKAAVDARTQTILDYEAVTRKLHLALPNEQCRYTWSARWVDQGCPRVVIDPKYAALLMATDMSKAVLEHVIVPWHAFLIEIPSDLLSTELPDGTLDPIHRIMFQSLVNLDGERVCNIIGVGNQLSLWRHSVPLTELASDTTPEEMTDWGTGIEVTSRDDRVVRMMGRLILSACAALTDNSNSHRQKPAKGSGYKNRRAQGLVAIQTFVLGRPIEINCRQAIQDYINTGAKRKGLTVQFMVRGHWRHQPYGPQHSLRKFIPIEPYWKGPEDAKILTRVVSLDKTGEANER
jgi:hypothetical protein